MVQTHEILNSKYVQLFVCHPHLNKVVSIKKEKTQYPGE